MRYTERATNFFRAVADTPRAGLAAVLFSMGLGVATAATPSVVTLPGAEAYPESITSTRDGTLYVGGFATGGVLRALPGASKAEPWIKPGAYGTRSTMGVLADEASNTLWVCSNDVSARGVPGPSSVKGSAVKGFDLKTGEGKISLALPGARTFCNDIAVGPDRSVYVTNTLLPQVLVLRPGSQALQVWVDDPHFEPPPNGGGLDGIAFGRDGNLYVTTITKGQLFRINVHDGKPGTITQLQTSRPTALTDGLRPAADHGFLLIEGVGNVDRMDVDGDKASIETLRSGFDHPTGVTEVGNTAWVAEGQLEYLLDPTKKAQGPRLPFKLYAVDLPEK